MSTSDASAELAVSRGGGLAVTYGETLFCVLRPTRYVEKTEAVEVQRDPRQIVGRDGGQGIASRRRELRKLLNPRGPASRPRQA